MAHLLDTYPDSESDATPAPAPTSKDTATKTRANVSLGSESTASTSATSTTLSAPVESSDTSKQDAVENVNANASNMVAVEKASTEDSALVPAVPQCPEDAQVVAVDNGISAAKRFRDTIVSRRGANKEEADRRKELTREEFTKLKIENRLTSAEEWSKLMKGKQFVELTDIGRMGTERKSSSSTVFIGVLYDKVPTKTAASGNKYATWLITNMRPQPFRLAVQMYDHAFETWSQNPEKSKVASRGSIVAILNAKVFPSRTDGKGMAGSRTTCSVNNAMQVAKLGDYPLLALCSGRSKADDRPCGAPIEKVPHNFGLCQFHQQEQLKKMGGRSAGSGMIARCVPPRHPVLEARMQEKQRIQQKKKDQEEREAQKRTSSARNTERMLDFEHRLLSTSSERNKLVLEASLSGKAISSTDASLVPVLGRGLHKRDGDMVLDSTTQKVDVSRVLKKCNFPLTANVPTKATASRDPGLPPPRKPATRSIPLPAFPVLDPNNPLASKRKLQQAFGTQTPRDTRFKIDLQAEVREEDRKKRETATTVASMNAIQEEFERLYGKEGASNLAMTPEEMERVRNAKSQGADLVIMERLDARDRVRHELEFRDEFDLQKATVLFLEVDAWHCTTCKMTSDHVGAKIACEEAHHPVTAKKVRKTRWECRKCFQSAFILDKGMPSRCEKCGHETFKQACFFKLKTAAMEKELLEKRGADHERYLEHETKRRSMNDTDEYAGLDKY